jgi:hypothetical protein
VDGIRSGTFLTAVYVTDPVSPGIMIGRVELPTEIAAYAVGVKTGTVTVRNVVASR